MGVEKNRLLRKKAKFKKGDYVRLSTDKHVFQKGYTGYWTRGIFLVDQVLERTPWSYRVKDLHQEPIQGVFYEKELQLVKL